jgi:hypothetical protein
LILDVRPSEQIVILKNSSENELFETLQFDRREWKEAKKLIVEEISTRPNPLDRTEPWECLNAHGVYDYQIDCALQESRKKAKTKSKEEVNKRALKTLCKEFNLPEYLGPLFINELKLSNLPGDIPAQRQAKILGLM